VVFIFKKKTPVVSAKSNLSDLANLIDEVGALSGDALKTMLKVKAMAETLKPYNEAMKRLKTFIDAMPEYDDDAEFVQSGSKYECVAGAREKTRTIVDIRAIKKKLGDDVFFKIAKVNLGDVDKYITATEQTKLGLVKTERTTRKVEVCRSKPI